MGSIDCRPTSLLLLYEPTSKAKARDSYIARLTGKPTSRALQSSKWQLIGKSQWCCSSKCGRPSHVLTNNWTRGNWVRSTTAKPYHRSHLVVSAQCNAESLLWLIGAVGCSLASYRRSNCSLTRAVDDRMILWFCPS